MNPHWAGHPSNSPLYPPPLSSLRQQQQYYDDRGGNDQYEDMLHGMRGRSFDRLSDSYARSQDTSYGHKYNAYEPPYTRNMGNNMGPGMVPPNVPSESGFPPGHYERGGPERNGPSQYGGPSYGPERSGPSQYGGPSYGNYNHLVNNQNQQRGPDPRGPDPIASMLKGQMAREQTGSFFNSPNQTPHKQPPSLAPKPAPLLPFGSNSAPNIAPNPAENSAIMMRLTTDGQIVPDARNGGRLKKLLGLADNKQIWLETRTGSASGNSGSIAQAENPLEDNKTYWYNPVTLNVTFDKPMHVNILPQSVCQKMLDMMTPCTLIVKRIYNKLTEETLTNFFSKYGKVAFVKLCKYKELNNTVKKNPRRNLAYLRMETIQSQKKILEESMFILEGSHEIEVRIPANRIFIARVPDGTQPNQLLRFISGEISRMGLNGYAIDAYFPLPYRQFAFCTVGGRQVGAMLALKADFYFNGASITVASCHTDREAIADNLFEEKIKDLVDQSQLARVRSLQTIGTEVKFLIEMLSKMRKFKSERMLLMQINTEFLKCTEEKLRNYLLVQDIVLEICREVALNEDEASNMDEVMKRKRLRLIGPNIAVNDFEEGGADEDMNFDEDQAANQMPHKGGFIISGTGTLNNCEEGEANTHIVKIISKK